VLFEPTSDLLAAEVCFCCTDGVGAAFVVGGTSLEIATPLVGVAFETTSEPLPLSVAVGSVVFDVVPIKEADALKTGVLAR
jgi:hypothetical protein